MNRADRWRWWWLVLLVWGATARGGESVPARLDWARYIVMGTPASGLVERVSVSPGERVRAGQELLRLDAGAQQAELAEAEAAVEETGLLLAEAERERDRTRALYDRTLLADHDLQLSLIAHARARTAAHAARAHLARVRAELEYRILKAPWAGRVVAVHGQPGQAVVGRERVVPLVELGGEGGLLARARLASAQLPGLREGAEVTVLAAGRRYAGVVRSLAWEVPPEGDDAPYQLSVSFDPAGDFGLRPGMPVTLELP